METQYKIKAISYSKPRTIIDGAGEVIATRQYVIYAVGTLTEIAGFGMRKVDEIEWSEDEQLFKIMFNTVTKVFPKKALITVQYLKDTEIFYEAI